MSIVREGAILSAFGFGLTKATTSLAYMTAMGSVTSSIGFVSELDFMIAMNLAAFATGFGIVWLVRAGRLAEGHLPQIPAVVAFAAGILLNAIQALSALPSAVLAEVLGSLCGFSTTILCVCWLEIFASQDNAQSSVYQIVCALLIQGVLISFLPLMSGAGVTVTALASILGSSILLKKARQRNPIPKYSTSLEQRPESRFRLFQSYICLFVLVGVVGILHTSVLGSSSEYIVGDVNMWFPLAVATVITAILASVTVRRPDPTSVYKGCFPCMLVILSLLPFMGEFLGAFTGLVMITCYDVCGMMFLVFIVERSRTLSHSSYTLSGLYLGGSSLFLFVGLSIGLLLGSLSVDYGLSLLTLLAFAAIYPLVIALVIVIRKGRVSGNAVAPIEEQQAMTLEANHCVSMPEASEPTLGSEPESSTAETDVDDSYDRRIADIAEEAELTKREREIMALLARGRSAKYIADMLTISENTVWTHIKRVYSKTGVSCKQELIDLVTPEGMIHHG